MNTLAVYRYHLYSTRIRVDDEIALHITHACEETGKFSGCLYATKKIKMRFFTMGIVHRQRIASALPTLVREIHSQIAIANRHG